MNHALRSVVVVVVVVASLSMLGGASTAPKSSPSTATATSASAGSSTPADSSPRLSTDATPTIDATASAHPTGMRCDACHTPGGWAPARFAHERTGFALQGRHVGVACGACHRREWTEPLPQNCAGCHVDPHTQEFGVMCSSCHTESSWQPLFLVDAHRRTQFPLSGRHATLPCEQCHVEKRDRTFTRAALGCRDCHAADAAQASASTLNHASLAPTCQSCHTPTSFAPARLPQHEACFPLPGTVHANIACATCHEPRALVGAAVTGTCRSLVRCAECHTHAKKITDAQHTGVVGYAHASDKCAACHRAAR
jgi:hypothetical protein